MLSSWGGMLSPGEAGVSMPTLREDWHPNPDLIPRRKIEKSHTRLGLRNKLRPPEPCFQQGLTAGPYADRGSNFGVSILHSELSRLEFSENA